MAKAKKNKKSNASDKLYDKKSSKGIKSVNPFEMKMNKEKFMVLNREQNHERGRPQVSRAKANDRRKETLGKEFDLQHKSNVFRDKRGAGPKIQKESIYNLNDSEVLTHHGQTLADIEKFDGPFEDEGNSSEDEDMRLAARYTEEAHFGGGSENPRDRKSVIDELIADSKKRKVERLKDNEELYELTKKLDDNWKELVSVMGPLQKGDAEKPVQDDFDRLVKEMVFSPRGEPTEKLKSEDDVARIEKEKLEALERDRLSRMRGDNDQDNIEDNKPKHRSADDLDDGYFAEEAIDDNMSAPMLSYSIDPKTDMQEERLEVPHVSQVSQENLDDSVNSERSDEEDPMDDLDDLKASSVSCSDDSENETAEIELPQSVIITPIPKEPHKVLLKPDLPPSFSAEEIAEIGKIPFTIPLPNCYEELMELLEEKSPPIQSILVERIIKTNHPRLLQPNRSKMVTLFAYLLQYINDLFANSEESNVADNFRILDELTPALFDLINMNPNEAAPCFLEVIKEKYEDFKKTPKKLPKLDTLVFFKILTSLFPTSDYRHPISTPCFLFMHHILAQGRIKTRSDVTSGLFICTLFLDQQELSQKWLPSVMNYLHGICYMGIRKSLIETLKPLPPFRKMDSILLFENEFKLSKKTDLRLTAQDFLRQEIDDIFKAKALNLAMDLMADFIQLYDEQAGMKHLLQPFIIIVNKLQSQELPKVLQKKVTLVADKLEQTNKEKKFKYTVQEAKKQKMLRMLEPKIEDVYHDRRAMYSQGGVVAEKQKLRHQVKREFKAAKRELRRDNEFLSKMQHKRKMDSDRERKFKVKRIFNEASVQQSEYNALQRTKGRKNKF